MGLTEFCLSPPRADLASFSFLLCAASGSLVLLNLPGKASFVSLLPAAPFVSSNIFVTYQHFSFLQFFPLTRSRPRVLRCLLLSSARLCAPLLPAPHSWDVCRSLGLVSLLLLHFPVTFRSFPADSAPDSQPSVLFRPTMLWLFFPLLLLQPSCRPSSLSICHVRARRVLFSSPTFELHFY